MLKRSIMRQAHQQRMKWVGTRNQDLLSANQRTVITKMLKVFSFIIFLCTFIILSVVANTMSRVNVFGDMCLWTGREIYFSFALMTNNELTAPHKSLNLNSITVMIRVGPFLRVGWRGRGGGNVKQNPASKPVPKYHEHQNCCLSNSHTFSNRKKKKHVTRRIKCYP